jgi:hypothetical protein
MVFQHNRAKLALTISRSKRNVRAIIRTVPDTRMRVKTQVKFISQKFFVVCVVCAAVNFGRHLVVVSTELSIMDDGSLVRRVLPNLALFSPPNWDYLALYRRARPGGKGSRPGKFVPL